MEKPGRKHEHALSHIKTWGGGALQPLVAENESLICLTGFRHYIHSFRHYSALQSIV